jgi:hypothetical protein
MDERLCKVRNGGWGRGTVCRYRRPGDMTCQFQRVTTIVKSTPARGDRSQTARERTCAVRRLYITILPEGGGLKVDFHTGLY